MESTAPSKTCKNAVEVFDKDLVEQLVIDGNDHIKTTGPKFFEKHIRQLGTSSTSCGYVPRSQVQRRSGFSKRPASTSPTLKGKNMDSDALIGHTLQLQKWLNEKTVHAVQKKSDIDAKNARRKYEPVLEKEATFVQEMESKAAQKDMTNLRKKEMLHHKWQQKVFKPIRNQIDRAMHSSTYDEFAKRKRAIHKEYIEHNNKKGHVFLDTFAPEEYYPMGLNPTKPSVLTAHTQSLRDPLLHQERELCEDDRVLFRCITGSSLNDKDIAKLRLPQLPLVPQGRHGTDSTTWVEMPLRNIESSIRQSSRRRMNPSSNCSQVNFHWNLDHLQCTEPFPRHVTNNILAMDPLLRPIEPRIHGGMALSCEV
ncbi:hypothetical protein CAPTEDRAFT_217718 [Capitella teleta]|uniref:Uncharacterized protein n=1 Tax=Capitella teleta TaxID=283909 RepID=X2AMK8_CAPTE|nr:hypothetical protein CAPTEDRAFT_217718 [Capitella teleta]|eukprot:ELU00333.1 hypothetical protein CAPTEDRAFT_217718 [Capitella teleta]